MPIIFRISNSLAIGISVHFFTLSLKRIFAIFTTLLNAGTEIKQAISLDL